MASQISYFRSFSAFKISYFVKRDVWLVFHQAGSSQNEHSLSLQENSSKNCLWVSHTFLQKRCFFKSFSISLEENCAANIIDERFKCKSFVGKFCKKEPLSKLYLPTKAKFFQSFLNPSIILKKFERGSFKTASYPVR